MRLWLLLSCGFCCIVARRYGENHLVGASGLYGREALALLEAEVHLERGPTPRSGRHSTMISIVIDHIKAQTCEMQP